ncbi:MAG: hypothetical protein E5W82_10560 [Mesorhizobium sp.]|nr:MAG: hypothetical protein E5W82_10560 [Mesorhizobium sp.]
MRKMLVHMGVTLRCYGNVEVAADTIEAALAQITADFLAENIDIKEVTQDSGQDLAVIDITDADTGEELAEYGGHSLPSPYDPQPDAGLLAALKSLRDWGREHTSPRDPNSPHILLVAASDAIAKAEGRAS